MSISGFFFSTARQMAMASSTSPMSIIALARFISASCRFGFSSSARLRGGKYRVTAISRDIAGHLEKPVRGRNTVTFRVG